MLDRVEITNFATIAYMSFDLGSSLNIITGETGSGQSVLVQAISTALGGRADRDRDGDPVRPPGRRARAGLAAQRGPGLTRRMRSGTTPTIEALP